MAKHYPPIAYIAQGYPSLTTTFIYREVIALEQHGFGIAAFSIWKSNKDKLSAESRDLVDNASYVFPMSWPRLLKTHFYFMATCPGKYLSTALFVLTRPGESIKNRLRTLFHFVEAVYLAREMQQRSIRHIHAHFSHNNASIALVISRLLGISFSFTAHNILFTDQLILKEKIREARFIVAISEFTRRFILNLVPGEGLEHKIHIVHCGVSPEAFVPPPTRPDHVVPELLFVAQLAERKGAPFLVEACRVLAGRGVKFRCVIIGGGAQKEHLTQLVEQYGLQNSVELKGAMFQEQVREYLERADVFVLPCIIASNGDMDGVPVSLMEAMAMEVPVISTYVSGIPELVQNEHSGLLVPEKDSMALADALQRLLTDKVLRLKLGKNGRQQVIQNFNIHHNADQLTALFERYLS